MPSLISWLVGKGYGGKTSSFRIVLDYTHSSLIGSGGCMGSWGGVAELYVGED